MHQMEQQDCAAVLDDWTNRVANLPAEIAFMQEEIAEKDRELQACLSTINKCDGAIQKWIRVNGASQENPKEKQYSAIIKENYDKAQLLQAEKIALATRAQITLDKHTRHLDKQIKVLQDRGEFPSDPDIPSLLRPQPHQRSARVEPSTPAMPLGAINNPAGAHARHPNQHPVRALPAQVQTHHVSGGSSSAPATPAAALLLQQRQAREASLGAAAIKRQKLTGGVGISTSGSGLARHSSLTPGTPRAGTPSGGRAGSVGPRISQKGAANKKVAPQGSRQSGVPRKSKPGKSSLSRVKRTGNKNSPSSTNDSDLSEVETGSGEEDDEAVTPHATHKDGEGDDDMVDIDDEEGGDDKKYCTCQSVSYGDMVACDNESCPYEWFHWSCVGLKSEPVGTWICPVCTKNMNKK
jgi:inhibitor of growth protein 3